MQLAGRRLSTAVLKRGKRTRLPVERLRSSFASEWSFASAEVTYSGKFCVRFSRISTYCSRHEIRCFETQHHGMNPPLLTAWLYIHGAASQLSSFRHILCRTLNRWARCSDMERRSENFLAVTLFVMRDRLGKWDMRSQNNQIMFNIHKSWCKITTCLQRPNIHCIGCI